ncbi:cyclase family protein [Blastococcus sp. URHD0036]|uniref:cyclase family protein n=1 Tax=Blastococcus sp. URHD0036 TaxID=1380356 RepID=UPI000497E829|nr:cyclase family protein [Blastococcus sp. URHD0036]
MADDELQLRDPRPGSPELSNWGVFGDDDQIGTLNFLTRAAVLRGVAAVRLGDRYPLSLPVDQPRLPGSGAWAFKPEAPPYRKPAHRINDARYGLVGNDDSLTIATQGSSQWDALIHSGADEDGVDGVFYNGVPRSAVDADGFAHRNGIDQVARVGIVGRGVLLDVARMVAGGAADPLPPGYVITPEETEACARHQGVVVESGEVVCFRTGWAEAYLAADDARRGALLAGRDAAGNPGQAGISPDHAAMAHAQRWAAVVADNAAVEAVPLAQPPAHVRMMRDLGLTFGELFQLGDLATACAADRRWEFLFVAAPLWIPGGMGSPANAVAIR